MDTNAQLPLLSRTPASRSRDGKGSWNAEDLINRSGTRATQQRLVLLAFADHPVTTTREAAELSNLDRYMVARRAPELRPIYLERIEGGGGWRWHLTEKGKEVVARLRDEVP